MEIAVSIERINKYYFLQLMQIKKKGVIIVKKWFSVLFVVVLLFSSTALADEPIADFSVRNGITFGMTKEQVKEVEAKNGITSFEENEHYNNINFYATVAGYDNCHVIYSFNDDNLLKEIMYYWGIPRSTPEAAANNFYRDTHIMYDTLAESLSQKYDLIGKLVNDREYSFIDFGTLKDEFRFMEGQSEYVPTDVDVYGFKQFLTPIENGFVEIGIVNEKRDMYLFGKLFDISVGCKIVYTYIPKEQYDAVIQKGIDLEQQRNNDL